MLVYQFTRQVFLCKPTNSFLFWCCRLLRQLIMRLYNMRNGRFIYAAYSIDMVTGHTLPGSDELQRYITLVVLYGRNLLAHINVYFLNMATTQIASAKLILKTCNQIELCLILTSYYYYYYRYYYHNQCLSLLICLVLNAQ